ncbi:hypothetical protein Pla100_34580 [Neorhodopirellula pilleata]|uniref:DUF4178 domain-containing protein n=1 Tax=Neorhodopirellula pilleata TaxID=2714738 RepID=A0A5C6A6A2_9BACT|nr:hypothetical protein Pla100_34580 [Neorhodopirellula pilleata]
MKGARSLKKHGGPCPNCAAPVEFRFGGTLVTICEFCNSAVARDDQDLKLIGKVAQLVQTQSLVQIGSTGSFRGKPFEVIGRVQYQHAAGGVWDEWYLRFPGDKMAWLAEAQGQIHLTFPRQIRKRTPVPDFEDLSVGQRIQYGENDLTVVEKGVAKAGSAQGEIPWAFQPNADHIYADLIGHGGWFATFEYEPSGNEIVAHQASVGRIVQPDELGIESTGWATAEQSDVVQVAILALNCPHCGGPIDLRLPDESQRVGCPNCGSLLDVNDGKLKVLLSNDQRDVHPVIPLGAVGKLRGKDFTVIGFMERYALYQRDVFPWTEYLLYNPDDGFRWLVCNDKHWSFVEKISPHGLEPSLDQIRYDGKSFRVYDRGTAYVRSVRGEFYWKVVQGEKATTADFICPPQMISFERSGVGKTSEINVSLGTYMTVDEIEKAFNLSDLRRPWGVGVIQPAMKFPVGIFLTWVVFFVFIVFVHGVAGSMVGPGKWLTKAPDEGILVLAVIGISVVPALMLLLKYNHEVTRWKDSDYSPYASES